MKVVLGIIFIFIARSSLSSRLCPENCECLTRSSKLTANCQNAGKTSVPHGLDSALMVKTYRVRIVFYESLFQVLDLSGNNLTMEAQDIFIKTGLNMLQIIIISRCSLTTIHSRAFSGLHNLKELDLSHNHLVQFPFTIFEFIPQLESLTMTGNSLSKIKKQHFLHLNNLRILNLSNCSIYHIEEGSFENLRKLTKLYVQENKLRVLNHLETFPRSLLVIMLQDNPWHCDCNLGQFKQWMAESKAQREVEPLCYSPGKLFGYRIEVLSLTDFACLPRVSPSSMFVSIPANNNASLVCTVSAKPSSEVSWSFNGSPVLNQVSKVRIMTSFIGDGNTRSELILTNVTRINNGTYTCVAKNNAGMATAKYVLSIEEHKTLSSRFGLDSQHFVLILILLFVLFLLILALSLMCLMRGKCNSKVAENKESKTPSKDISTPKRSGIQMGKSTIPSKRINREKMGSGYLCGRSCIKPDYFEDHYMNNFSCSRSCKRNSSRTRQHQRHLPASCLGYPSSVPFTASCGACIFLGSLDTQCVHCYNYAACSRLGVTQTKCCFSTFRGKP